MALEARGGAGVDKNRKIISTDVRPFAKISTKPSGHGIRVGILGWVIRTLEPPGNL